MTLPLITTIPAKRIRAAVIADYMQQAGYRRAVCFTCGNAADALRDAGVDVIEVGPRGPMMPTRWWTPAQVRRSWPDAFDATPGHLAYHLMIEVAQEMRDFYAALGDRFDGGPFRVPTGSGETITCMRIAFPHATLLPAFDVPGLHAETAMHTDAAIVDELLYADPGLANTEDVTYDRR